MIMKNTEEKFNTVLVKLSQGVKKARAQKKLRQMDMIEYGFSERFIQKIESGRYSPNLYTIHRLAEALDVTISELFK